MGEVLFSTLLEWLLAARVATVLVIEDAHWADEATLDLLRFLARRLGAAPVLLVVTYRDDEVGPLHPMQVVAGDLATSALVRRLRLAPLSRQGVAVMAGPHGVDPDTLYETTGGNPFFVTEVLAADARHPGHRAGRRLARAARRWWPRRSGPGCSPRRPPPRPTTWTSAWPPGCSGNRPAASPSGTSWPAWPWSGRWPRAAGRSCTAGPWPGCWPSPAAPRTRHGWPTTPREAVAWGGRAIGLAERLGQPEILAHALNNVGTAEMCDLRPSGRATLELSLALALANGLEEHVARAYTNLASIALDQRAYALAARYRDQGIRYCAERDLDTWGLAMLADQARADFDHGRWTEATRTVEAVLRDLRTSPPNRIDALVVLGLVRARRGDPGVWAPLDEALPWGPGLGSPGSCNVSAVAAARAEAAC